MPVTNGKDPALRAHGPFGNHQPEDAIITDTPVIDRAVVAAIVVKLRLAQHHVHEGNAGDFLCSKYGLSRWCRDGSELREFAVRLGLNP